VSAPFPERRRARRGYPLAAALLVDERYVGTYAVENLSREGALLVGPPRIRLHQRVQLRLVLVRAQKRFNLVGRVVRDEPRVVDEHAFAIAFEEVPRIARALIEDAVRSAPDPTSM
jgi:hypothetical protein